MKDSKLRRFIKLVSTCSNSSVSNGKIHERSSLSWEICEHKHLKTVEKEWISHVSALLNRAQGIASYLTAKAVVKHGYTIWCVDCNRIMKTAGE